MHKNITMIDHPLAKHALSTLRDKNTDTAEFRKQIYAISLLLIEAATHNFKTKNQAIETPLEKTHATFLADTQPFVIPILRAGLGMLEAFLTLFPQAKVGFIGLQRNEKTLASEEYYFKIPKDSSDHPVIIVDPMLATGGSSIACVDRLKAKGISDISIVNIIAAPEGIENFTKHHPDVKIYLASIDRELNQNSYIVPGLGDAGDRLYGTE